MSSPNDFSFVGSDGGLQRKQQQPTTGSQQAGPSAGDTPGSGGPAVARPAARGGQRPSGGIAIPSFREVQRVEKQRVMMPILFRPSGAAAAAAAGSGSAAVAGSGHSRGLPATQQQVSISFGDGGAPLPQQHQHQQPRFTEYAQYRGQGIYRPQGALPFQQRQQQRCRAPIAQQQPYQHQQQQCQPSRLAPGTMRPPPPVTSTLQQQLAPQEPHPGFQHPMLPPQQQQQQFPANSIIVNKRQEGNPVLKYIRNVRWQFGDVTPDYLLGREAACLFLSLRYHLLKPEYIHHRIKELQRSYRLRIIMCHVDTEDAVEPLAQVTRAAIGNDCTLVCGWSNQECARYLETFKSYENKPAEVIQQDLGTDYLSRINAVLTTVRGVNKTDVKTLGDRFGSVAAILKASAEDLQTCPGIGPTKARRLHETFYQPFRRSISAAAATPLGITASGAAGGAGMPAARQHEEQHQQQRQNAAADDLPPEQRQSAAFVEEADVVDEMTADIVFEASNDDFL